MRKLLLFLSSLLVFSSPAMAEPVEHSDTELKTAVFAGGCFWCVEAAFDDVEGVVETLSGYTGGEKENPTYQEVSSGTTGHYEALQVKYDPKKVGYDALLDVFWESIDPLDAGGQFADRGSQYHTAIFFANEDEKKIAEASRDKVEKKLGQKVVTKLLPAEKFYVAEEYHQDYHKKNNYRYQMYKFGSGRPDRLKKLWGDKE